MHLFVCHLPRDSHVVVVRFVLFATHTTTCTPQPSPSLNPSPSPSLIHSPSLNPSHSLSLSVSLSLSLSIPLPLTLSLTLYHSLPVSLSLNPSPSHPPSQTHRQTQPNSLSLSLCPSLSVPPSPCGTVTVGGGLAWRTCARGEVDTRHEGSRGHVCDGRRGGRKQEEGRDVVQNGRRTTHAPCDGAYRTDLPRVMVGSVERKRWHRARRGGCTRSVDGLDEEHKRAQTYTCDYRRCACRCPLHNARNGSTAPLRRRSDALPRTWQTSSLDPRRRPSKRLPSECERRARRLRQSPTIDARPRKTVAGAAALGQRSTKPTVLDVSHHRPRGLRTCRTTALSLNAWNVDSRPLGRSRCASSAASKAHVRATSAHRPPRSTTSRWFRWNVSIRFAGRYRETPPPGFARGTFHRDLFVQNRD